MCEMQHMGCAGMLIVYCEEPVQNMSARKLQSLHLARSSKLSKVMLAVPSLYIGTNQSTNTNEKQNMSEKLLLLWTRLHTCLSQVKVEGVWGTVVA